MKPKEKASELVNKYFVDIDNTDWYDAKQCALITVDEILDITIHEYWKEVKQEIEKI